MERPTRLLILSLLVPAALAACGGAASSTRAPDSPASQRSAAAPSWASTQRSESGQVTVEATWAGPAAGAAFDVKLDTHSVGLDSLDLSNAVLRNDRGETLSAQPWTAPKGGHHRQGTLSFGGNVAGFFAGVKWIELILTGVGDVPERTLRWEIGS